MKRNICFFLIFFLLVNSIDVTTMSAASVPISMQLAYDEIVLKRSDWSLVYSVTDFDIDVWNEYDVLVMDIAGTFPDNLAILNTTNGASNDYDYSAGEYRYIGVNPDGYLVNNPRYPEDHSGSRVINTYDWQINSDKKTQIYSYISTPEDQAFYEREIFYFLETEYGDRFDETSDPGPWLDNAIVIIPVSTTGDGVIKYMHKWDSDSDGKIEDWYITVNLRAKDEVLPAKASAVNYESVTTEMKPLSETRIASDERDEEIFDVTQGIPSGEELYVNVSASEYIHSEEYLKVSGAYDYEVEVHKNYRLWRWNDAAVLNDLNGDGDFDDLGETVGDWESRLESVSKTYSVHRPYSYYEIDDLNIYKLAGASIDNEAIPGGHLSMVSHVDEPEIVVNHEESLEGHLQLPSSSEMVSVSAGTENVGKLEGNTFFPSVPDESLRSYAENALDSVEVRNDSLVVDGYIVLDDRWVDQDGPDPQAVPEAQMNPSDDLYMDKIVIDEQTTNGLKLSTGYITYDLIYSFRSNAADSQRIPIDTINDVMVHTPVVCYPKLNEISRQTQLSHVEENVSQLVLEESFHLDYSYHGLHLMIPGYGNNDYEKYTLQKQVKFPFDVYIGNGYDGLFLPKNTWGNFTSSENNFFLPSWAEEGDGYILFRSLANNIPDIEDETYEYYGNFDAGGYKAVDAIPFHIGGKVHSLMVTDCGDDFWLQKLDESPLLVGKNFDGSGLDNGFGRRDNLDEEGLLPLMPGKKSLESDSLLDGLMLGYGIDFQLVTNGELTGANDYVYISTSFDYVPNVSGKPNMDLRIPVDLYISEFGHLEAYDRPIVLDSHNRRLIGQEGEKHTSISQEVKKASVQLWSSSFFLPNMTYCVPSGTDLTSYKNLKLDGDPFLHDGYIVGNFEVFVFDDLVLDDSIREIMEDKNADYTKLQTLRDFFENQESKYKYSLGWQHEGYELTQKGLQLKEGDIIFYSTDKRAGQTYY